MSNIHLKDINDIDRFQIRSLHRPGRMRNIAHGTQLAQCLAWLLMSRTMGDYRKQRRAAGHDDDGGYIKSFIRDGIVTVRKKRNDKRAFRVQGKTKQSSPSGRSLKVAIDEQSSREPMRKWTTKRCSLRLQNVGNLCSQKFPA